MIFQKPAEKRVMCKVKGCARPSFVGGLCGFHALEGWSGPGRSSRRAPSVPAVTPPPSFQRRRPATRPASG